MTLFLLTNIPDSLAISEPKYLVCCACGARVLIDGPDGHHTAVDDLPHTTTCEQRDVVSRYYLEQFVE